MSTNTFESMPNHLLGFTTLALLDEAIRRVGRDEVCRRLGVGSIDEFERWAAEIDSSSRRVG